MTSFENLTSGKLMILAKLRNVDGYICLDSNQKVYLQHYLHLNLPLDQKKPHQKNPYLLHNLKNLHLKTLSVPKDLRSIYLMTTNQKRLKTSLMMNISSK